MASSANMNYVFNAKSVAIVGISTASTRAFGGGRPYLDALLSCNFPGQIYPINPKGGEISDFKVYRNVKDVPGPIDYVICCIPAAQTPKLIRDCAAKGVKVVQFLTSGFSEHGSEQGRRLEAEICQIARRGGIRLIGPNCVGVYCPKSGLSFAPDFPAESGTVAFICQSGGNALYLTRLAASRGVRFSKVVSYGNACDVDESDLVEYFITDAETEIVAIYIEGVKDGERFKEILREAARQKPVVVMKGGNTEAAARTAASHTNALTGAVEIWDGLLRQAGVIQVSNLEEMVDVLVTFLYLPVPRGRRLGSIGVGGAATVLAADSYPAAGFILPSLPQEMQQKLRSFTKSDAGLTLDNPVDFSSQYFTPAVYPAVKALADYDGVDMLIFHLPCTIIPPVYSVSTEAASSLLDDVIRVRTETNKPVAVVISNFVAGESWQVAFNCAQKCSKAGIPVYFYIGSAARAIDRFLCYYERRASSNVQGKKTDGDK